MNAVIWTAHDRHYAIDAEHVVEVVPAVQPRPLDQADAWVRGLMNHRGTLIPLIDACALLGGGAAGAPRRASRILVLEIGGAEGGGSVRLGLLVDRALSAERIDVEGAAAHPGLEIAETAYLGPVVLHGETTIQVVDPGKILDAEQRRVLFGRAGTVPS